MNILTIPLRCARKKWLRTLSLFCIFTLGVASIVALREVSAVVGESLERKLTSFGANIMVAPARETLTVSYGGLPLGDLLLDEGHLPHAETARRIRSIEFSANIASVAPKLVTMARIGSPAGAAAPVAPLPVAVIGVDWPEELSLKGYWAIDGAAPKTPEGVLAGHTVAARLGLAPGRVVDVNGHAVTVTGVIGATGSDDDNVLLADIGFVQRVFNLPDKASFVEVAALCAGCPIDDIVAQLRTALPGQDIKALRHVVEQRMYSVHFAQQLALVVSLVILLTACAMVVMSMLSAVNERRREIGILRSVGFSRSGVFTVFASEALLVGVAAGLAGYLSGHGLALKVLALLHMADVAPPVFSPAALALTTGGIAAVSVLAAAFPAWKASRVEPAAALVSL
ncbi:MAG: ABC transporter permease [Desulfovibrio sp.]|jgi:putative ABC transport system permease protein|nr:ABC transporter permease [Desulfovibrio sp.]